MKILIVCSKKFYDRIPAIKAKLERNNHTVFLPNSYDDPNAEDKMKSLGETKHKEFKAAMFKQSAETIANMDAILVLNLDREKDGKIYPSYIVGATFLEMYDAFRMNKKIFLFNNIPEGILKDEIIGFDPIVINKHLDLVI